MKIRLAIGIIRSVGQFERNALGAGRHAGLESLELVGGPARRRLGGHLRHQFGPGVFQGHAGIHQHHPRPALQQGLGTGHTRRPGADDEVGQKGFSGAGHDLG